MELWKNDTEKEWFKFLVEAANYEYNLARRDYKNGRISLSIIEGSV